MDLDRGAGMTHDIQVGWNILTQDGHEIGTVSELHGSHFKIDAPMQPDYWLPMSCIGSSSSGRIMLNFHHDHLDDWKVHNLEAA
jgi:hypothetical protein